MSYGEGVALLFLLVFVLMLAFAFREDRLQRRERAIQAAMSRHPAGRALGR